MAFLASNAFFGFWGSRVLQGDWAIAMQSHKVEHPQTNKHEVGISYLCLTSLLLQFALQGKRTRAIAKQKLKTCNLGYGN